MKNKSLLFSVLLIIAFIGMGASCRPPSRDIMSVSTSVVGIDISQDAADHTPHIRLGYVRTQFHLVPTSNGTNGISAPAVANTMSVNSQPLHNQINESFSTGTATDSTGDAPTIQLPTLK